MTITNRLRTNLTPLRLHSASSVRIPHSINTFRTLIPAVRLRPLKIHETELKWIKLLQTPFSLGFNENNCHEGNISKIPDFDVFSLLQIRKRKSRSHGVWKKGNVKRKKRVVKRSWSTFYAFIFKFPTYFSITRFRY